MPAIFVATSWLVTDCEAISMDGTIGVPPASSVPERLGELHDREAVQDAADQRDAQLDAVPHQPPAGLDPAVEQEDAAAMVPTRTSRMFSRMHVAKLIISPREPRQLRAEAVEELGELRDDEGEHDEDHRRTRA